MRRNDSSSHERLTGGKRCSSTATTPTLPPTTEWRTAQATPLTKPCRISQYGSIGDSARGMGIGRSCTPTRVYHDGICLILPSYTLVLHQSTAVPPRHDDSVGKDAPQQATRAQNARKYTLRLTLAQPCEASITPTTQAAESTGTGTQGQATSVTPAPPFSRGLIPDPSIGYFPELHEG